MTTFLPLYALVLQLLLSIVGAFLFTREYKLRFPILTPVSLTMTFLPFQILLGISAVRAVYREWRKQNNWEKTDHLGAHRQPEVALAPGYEMLLEEALDRVGAERGSVMAYDAIQNAFSIKASRGLPNEIVSSARVKPDEGVVGWIAQHDLPMILNGKELPHELRARLRQPALRSSIVLPMKQSDGTAAVLSVSSKVCNYSYEDLDRVKACVKEWATTPAKSSFAHLEEAELQRTQL
jgi:hypothetical protein